MTYHTARSLSLSLGQLMSKVTADLQKKMKNKHIFPYILGDAANMTQSYSYSRISTRAVPGVFQSVTCSFLEFVNPRQCTAEEGSFKHLKDSILNF